MGQRAARSAPSVHVHAAGLIYEGRPLFADLDFTLAGARWTCLLGPSGVGKTSLLRLIAGLAPAAPGTLIRGDDGTAIAGRIAWMAQQDLLLPWLTATDNVLLGARLRGERPDQVRAAELLERVGVAERAHARPAQLSGGERQRVALARTLIEDRPIVLMDEPFSGLDAITRSRLQELAARLLGGRTVLLITHDPLEALRLGHYVYVMSGQPARLGEAIVPAGTPPRDPANPTLLAAQADLLKRLAAADRAAAA
jgi:putative hydroxymethylpyrimidine transport system ATP-binding protein